MENQHDMPTKYDPKQTEENGTTTGLREAILNQPTIRIRRPIQL